MTGHGERGSATVFMIALTGCTFLMVAFLLVGGRMLQARSDAFGLAAAAARVGAQELDDDAAVEGLTVLDPVAAERAALVYLDAHGVTGTVSVTNDTVTVTVTARADRSLRDGEDAGEAEFRATATAQAIKVPAP